MSRRDAVSRCRTMLLCMAALLLPLSLYASTTTVTISGGEQHATSGAWDGGSLGLTVDGHTETVTFGQFSTVQSVASGLAAKFSQDCQSPVQAHAVGAIITFTTKRLDVSFQQVSASAVWDSADFTQASFGIGQNGSPGTQTLSLALSCTPNPVPAGGAADCTASLPKGATGTVSFSVDGQPVWSTADVDGDGWAPASTLSGLASGSHTLSASYSGDGHYNPTSQTLGLPVDSGDLVSGPAYWYTITPSGGPSGYAANGNILSYTDSVNGSWSMGTGGYDSLNRLVAATQTPVGSSTQQNWCWAYDSFGNRQAEAYSSATTLSGTSCPTNSSLTVQVSSHVYDATNKITLDSMIQYDPLGGGNVTVDHDNSYLYDGDGRVCAVSNAGGMTQYIYDGDGNRVAKGSISLWSCDMTPDPSNNNLPHNGFQATSSYVLGLGGEQVTEMSINSGQSTWAHTNVYAGGMLVATYDPLGLHFQLTDWLGSRRVQTNAFGQVEETWTNAPYGNYLTPGYPSGAPLTADDATEHHFTGKERDTESGNDFFGARYLSNSMGRWLSPDWSDSPDPIPYADTDNPQTLNLFGYVGNNPLTDTDEDGHIDPHIDQTCNWLCKMLQHIGKFLGPGDGPIPGSGAGDYWPNEYGRQVAMGVGQRAPAATKLIAGQGLIASASLAPLLIVEAAGGGVATLGIDFSEAEIDSVVDSALEKTGTNSTRGLDALKSHSSNSLKRVGDVFQGRGGENPSDIIRNIMKNPSKIVSRGANELEIYGPRGTGGIRVNPTTGRFLGLIGKILP